MTQTGRHDEMIQSVAGIVDRCIRQALSARDQGGFGQAIA